MKNIDLEKKYDGIYKDGAYENYYTFNQAPAERLILDSMPSWLDLEVLDIGCAEGNLAAMISFAGAKKVDGIDFSQEAIDIAKERINIKNVDFVSADYKTITNKYDVVVMNGVLEHFDNPWEDLEYIAKNLLHDHGYIITASPSFLNPRGYVWMTLALLFDAPMSLSDLHFLNPFDFEEFCEKQNYTLVIKSCDQDWGAGERTIVDFNKRLRNALKDADMDNSKVDLLLAWLEKAMPFFQADDFSGATVIYKVGRNI